MLLTGDQINNPLTKKTYIFLRTANDTNGEYVRMNCIADINNNPNRGFVHKHPYQTEVITVVSGNMMTKVNGKKVMYSAGEMLVIKPGEAHQWWNASKKEKLNVITEIRPAMKIDQLYKSTCTLAQARTTPTGEAPTLLHIAVMLDHYQDHYVMAGKWTLVKKTVFKFLAFIGRLKGYELTQEIDSLNTPKSAA